MIIHFIHYLLYKQKVLCYLYTHLENHQPGDPLPVLLHFYISGGVRGHIFHCLSLENLFSKINLREQSNIINKQIVSIEQ